MNENERLTMIKIEMKDYAAVVLLSDEGEIVTAGMTPLNRLFDVPIVKPDDIPNGVWLHIVEFGNDRVSLCDKLAAYLTKRGRADLIAFIHPTNSKPPPRQVMCIDTGEVFGSANAASLAYGIAHSNLYNHLRERPGYKTVKGKVFKYV